MHLKTDCHECFPFRHGDSDHSSPDRAHRDLLESFQSLRVKPSERKVSTKVSPAMSSLQGYYGLKGTTSSSENGPSSRNSPMSERPLSHHRKSKSLVNVILEEIMEKSDISLSEGNSNNWNDKLNQRREKSVADFTRIPELLLKEDNGSSGGLPSRTGKGLALRQKAASRTAVATDSESSGLNPGPLGLGDAFPSDGSSGVRKSSSTSCLHDQDNSGCSSSIWPASMWSLKPDLQARSTAGKPIFDGLPKPISGRRNKAALD